MLVDRTKVIHRLRSPENVMFYGHSSFHSETNTLLTSAISYQGYDFKPHRRPQQKFSNDITFGNGHIYQTDLETFNIRGHFESGGMYPHDQHLIGNELTVINSRNNRENQSGLVTLIDVPTKKVKGSLSCKPGTGYCATAHMYRGPTQNVIVGVSNDAAIISYLNDQLITSPLNSSVQSNYKPGEMLNAAFDFSGKRICAMNIDNGFLGLWDAQTLNLIKYSFENAIVSVNQFESGFIAVFRQEIRFYDNELNLIKVKKFNEPNLLNYHAFGPHSIIC